MNTVVLLAELGAYWYRWDKHELVGYFEQLFPATGVETAAKELTLLLPNWEAHCFKGVELVIDSPAQEISVQLIKPSLVNSLGFGDWRRVKRKLSRGSEHCVVSRFGAALSNKGFLVSDFNCNAVLVAWRKQLQQSTVTVKTVSSLGQKMLTRAAKDCSHGLFVFLFNNQLKHLYSIDGQLVFIRSSLVSNNDREIVDSIEASYKYIVEQPWSVEKFELFTFGLSVALQQMLTSSSTSLGVTTNSAEPFHSQILHSIPSSSGMNSCKALSKNCEIRSHYLTPIANEPFVTALNHPVCTQSFRTRKLDRRANSVVALVSSLLFINLIILAYARLEHLNARAELNSVQSNLQASIDDLDGYLRRYSNAYRSLANALHQAELLGHAVEAPTGQMLSSVAIVLTKHKELTLEQLSWSVIDRENDTHSTPQSMKLTQAFRRRMPPENANKSDLIVVLKGSVAASLDLKRQQAVFNEFVSQIKSVQPITHVGVEHSPLHGIQETSLSRGVESNVPAVYTIRFTYRG